MLIHRWMGVAFCLLFAMWFVSGMVLMYCPYPRAGPEDRLAHAELLDPAHVLLAPGEAFRRFASGGAQAEPASLAMMNGRPVYRFGVGRRRRTVYADTGEALNSIDKVSAAEIAAAWSGRPAAEAVIEGPSSEPDQWTVPQALQAMNPFWRVSWKSGERAYVSVRTGEVAQYTTTASRWGGWFGAVPHWLYFTPLRKDPKLWNSLVVWLSGIGTVMSVLGMVAGIWLYSPAKRYRFPGGASSVPYSGQKRLHVILGLVFGLVTCTWVFSGMLSMGPFEWLHDRDRRPDLSGALRGRRVDLKAFDTSQLQRAINDMARRIHLKEVEFTAFGLKPALIGWESPAISQAVSGNGESAAVFPVEEIQELARRGAAPFQIADAVLINAYEAYYVDRHGRLPLPALRIRLNDPDESLFYIDPKTARVVQSYGHASRWNRWLYHGLHSFDLPLLYRNRPLWDILVIALMAGGTWLCVTAVVIAVRRIRSRVRSVRSTRGVPHKQADHARSLETT